MDKKPPQKAENSGVAAKIKKPRGKGRPFPPGVSGNPGGRPRSVKEVQELASQYTEEAVLTLVSVMRNCSDPKEVRQAAIAILNRACGMPAQPMTGGAGEPLETEFPTLLGALKKLAGEE
ncbi:MAG: hypothetical protein ABUS79_03625 [Pseudomonadota bacterium]